MISAKVIAHSKNIWNSKELATLEVTMPRCILAEFNTHRQFSRNSASSRAIPVKKMIERIRKDPYLPVAWCKNEPGMQAWEPLPESVQMECNKLAIAHLDTTIRFVEELIARGVHKQYANRYLEPFAYHTVIVSATEWSNFFAQRMHKDAEPHMQIVAQSMYDALRASSPRMLGLNDWHLPYIQPDEMMLPYYTLCKVSVARCARVSYLTQDGVRDIEKDIELYDRLLGSGHWSPFEHVAYPVSPITRSGNFKGFKQYRKKFKGECR